MIKRSCFVLAFCLFGMLQAQACTSCERLQFAFDIQHTAANTSTVAIKIKTSSGTVDLGGITFYLYYDDNETTVISDNDGAIVGAPLSFGTGNRSIIFHDPTPNGAVGITHTGFYFYQNVDDDLSGFTVTTSYTTVLTIDFDHTDGALNYGGEAFLASTCEQSALAWSDPNGDEFDVCVIGLQSQLLPIELSSFNAQRQNGDAFLTWETLSESNASHFEVERRTANTSWSSLGQVEAKGGVQTTASYSYVDLNVMDHTDEKEVFYRLKLVDQDFTFEYSNKKLVLFELAQSGVQIYPNPSSGKFVVEGTALQVVEIYDNSGRLEYRKVLDQVQNSMELDISDHLTKGVYFIKVFDGLGNSKITKLVIGL